MRVFSGLSICWLNRLDAASSLLLYEEMTKEQADFLPLHVARLHSLDSEKVTLLSSTRFSIRYVIYVNMYITVLALGSRRKTDDGPSVKEFGCR